MTLIPTDLYDAHPGITKSAICKARIEPGVLSMAHMHFEMIRRRDDGEGETPARRWGTLAHMALLEPVQMLTRCAVYVGDKRGKAWTEFKEQHADKHVLTVSEASRLADMSAALRSDRLSAGVLRQVTATEQPIAWEDEEGRYKAAKGRPDAIGNGLLVEYKTTGQISRGRFLRSASAMGYQLGLAWYWHGLGRPGNVRMIVQEAKPPYSVAVFDVPQTGLEAWYVEAADIASAYRVAEMCGSFPGPYSQNMLTYEVPVYSHGESEEDVSNGTMEATGL